MASNDFLTFAGGSGANVLSQPDYAALTAILSNGFTAGTALSAQVNKVLRQASIMSAVLAQFSVDLTGSNAVDDGTTATLLAMLKTAVSAQSVGVVGTSRNAKMYIPTAGTTGTFTADEVILETALGGQRYSLASVSDTFNLTTDMDTGTAPVSGFVALYKLYNPTTKASIRRIVNATSAIAPEIYAGAAPPAGYTASALVAVLPTNASGQFIAGTNLRDRTVSFPPRVAATIGTYPASYLGYSVASAIPLNAKDIGFIFTYNNGSTGVTMGFDVAGDTNGIGQASYVTQYGAANTSSNARVPIVIPQTVCVRGNGAGSPTFQINATSYSF
ncbi:hypothetical protein PMO31116_04150 [Pandoraea morbifera]|uniref:Phage tail protein n=1 Tax=Pandoraea morbifera TaxID=2508300 RepID=A0A5E4XZG0_9BURK|nr:hypothetical protein [Pandoraea morbifera]VVE41677.1 hypothetical protein PMO31116_04150 [Pandoraea morbifera]